MYSKAKRPMYVILCILTHFKYEPLKELCCPTTPASYPLQRHDSSHMDIILVPYHRHAIQFNCLFLQANQGPLWLNFCSARKSRAKTIFLQFILLVSKHATGLFLSSTGVKRGVSGPIQTHPLASRQLDSLSFHRGAVTAISV